MISVSLFNLIIGWENVKMREAFLVLFGNVFMCSQHLT